MKNLHLIKFEDGYVGIRDKAVILTFYCTGIRLSELINLKLQDINYSKNQIKVLGKRNKERVIPVSEELLQLVKEYLKLSIKKLMLMFFLYH